MGIGKLGFVFNVPSCIDSNIPLSTGLTIGSNLNWKPVSIDDEPGIDSGSGSSGSSTSGYLAEGDLMSAIPEYANWYNKFLDYLKKNDLTADDLAFDTWMRNYHKVAYDDLMQKIENYIETGDPNKGNNSHNTLDDSRYTSGYESGIFQTEDPNVCYQIDWATGKMIKLEGVDAIAKALGISSTHPDLLIFGNDRVEAIKYAFTGLDDGQHSENQVLGSRYSRVSMTTQEFDLHYIIDSMYMDPSDPQYAIAMGILADLMKNINQWCSPEDQAALNKLDVGSDEYKAKLKALLLKYFDEEGNWDENHSHVTQDTSTGGAGGSGGTGGAGGAYSDSTMPATIGSHYNRNDIMKDCGADNQYRVGATCYMSDGNGQAIFEDHSPTAMGKAMDWFDQQAQQQLGQVKSALLNHLMEELGLTDTTVLEEILDEAIALTIEQFKAHCETDYKNVWKSGADYGKGFHECAEIRLKDGYNGFGLVFRSVDADGKSEGYWLYNYQQLVDAFFENFDKLYEEKANGGGFQACQGLAVLVTVGLNVKDYNLGDYYGEYSTDGSLQTAYNRATTIINTVTDSMLQKLAEKFDVSLSVVKRLLDSAGEMTLERLKNTNDWYSMADSNPNIITVCSDVILDVFGEYIKELLEKEGFSFNSGNSGANPSNDPGPDRDNKY